MYCLSCSYFVKYVLPLLDKKRGLVSKSITEWLERQKEIQTKHESESGHDARRWKRKKPKRKLYREKWFRKMCDRLVQNVNSVLLDIWTE